MQAHSTSYLYALSAKCAKSAIFSVQLAVMYRLVQLVLKILWTDQKEEHRCRDRLYFSVSFDILCFLCHRLDFCFLSFLVTLLRSEFLLALPLVSFLLFSSSLFFSTVIVYSPWLVSSALPCVFKSVSLLVRHVSRCASMPGIVLFWPIVFLYFLPLRLELRFFLCIGILV